MIRKPKKHPVYGMNLVGINFRERWNVLQYATKEELETFIKNFNHIDYLNQICVILIHIGRSMNSMLDSMKAQPYI